MSATASIVDSATAGESAVGAPARLRLSVVIVHYKTPGLLKECLASVLPQMDVARDLVIVVDNASPDGSARELDYLNEVAGVRFIASEKNVGFAGANNLAIRAAGAEFYMLLNPDTVMRPGAVGQMMEFAARHPEAALVGPQLEYPDGTAQLSAFGDATPVSELLRGANFGPLNKVLKKHQVYGPIVSETKRTDWLAGACLLVRREVFDAVGLLDDRYFMYYEEADFCRRARQAGFGCWYFPEAHVVHLVGQASGVTWQAKPLPGYWFESRHRYFRAHFGWLGVLAADVGYLIGCVFHDMRKLLTGKANRSAVPHEFRDLIRYEARHLFCGMPEPRHL